MPDNIKRQWQRRSQLEAEALWALGRAARQLRTAARFIAHAGNELNAQLATQWADETQAKYEALNADGEHDR